MMIIKKWKHMKMNTRHILGYCKSYLYSLKVFKRIKNIQILKEIEKTFEYELPDNLVGIIWKGKFRGQRQKWFITKFIGDENEINLKTKNPEFIEWKWVSPEDLPNIIVDFKKEMYLDLLKNIKRFID